jgi:hypothetical protein
MIEVQEEAAVMQRQRRPLAEGHVHAHLHAEVLLPQQLAVHVVRVEATGTKEREQARAVGDRRVGCEAAVGPVIPLVRGGDGGRPLPQQLPRRPIDGEHLEAVLEACVRAAAGASRRRGGHPFPRRDGGGQEHSIARDHWRRVSTPRDLQRPAHGVRAPLQWRVPHGHAVVEGTAPLRPLGSTAECRQRDRENGGGARREQVHPGRIP